jgi:DNA invertase Pin-like site-specific DNA recombinase
MDASMYLRVSTDKQTTENQRVLEDWGRQLGLVVKVTYCEEESAWKDGHQVELPRLLQDAARGKFKIVLVWALDRLTRQGILTQFELLDRLAKFGVQVYSFQEPWTLAPTRYEYELLLAIAAYIAQGESKRRSERTKAGIERLRRQIDQLGSARTRSGNKITVIGRPPGSKDRPGIKRRRKRIAWRQLQFSVPEVFKR